MMASASSVSAIANRPLKVRSAVTMTAVVAGGFVVRPKYSQTDTALTALFLSH